MHADGIYNLPESSNDAYVKKTSREGPARELAGFLIKADATLKIFGEIA